MTEPTRANAAYSAAREPETAGHDDLADAVDALVAERDRARHLATHLFQMIDSQTWRDSGGDDGQGHYEGEYHAAKLEEEIKSWA